MEVEDIAPWVLCVKCGQVEASRWANLASSFVWEEEAMERFQLRSVTVNLKKI